MPERKHSCRGKYRRRVSIIYVPMRHGTRVDAGKTPLEPKLELSRITCGYYLRDLLLFRRPRVPSRDVERNVARQVKQGCLPAQRDPPAGEPWTCALGHVSNLRGALALRLIGSPNLCCPRRGSLEGISGKISRRSAVQQNHRWREKSKVSSRDAGVTR